MNQKVFRKSGIDCDSSGCSCMGLLIDNNIEKKEGNIVNYGKIIVSSVGDCKVLQFYKNDMKVWLMRQLNSDINMVHYGEQQRIMENGGVIEDGKIYQKGENIPGIELSRGFGMRMGRCLGVIAVPDINIYTIDKQEVYLLIGSQSFVSCISYEEVLVVCYYRLQSLCWKVGRGLKMGLIG